MHHDLELSHECFQVRNVGRQLHHLHSNHCLFLPGLDPKRVSLHHLASGRVNIREETRLVRSNGATDSYLSKGSSSELLSQDQPFSRELKLPVCNSLQTILSLLLVVWEKISLFVDRQCLGRFCLGSSLGEFCTLFMLLMSPSSNNRSSAAVNCRT